MDFSRSWLPARSVQPEFQFKRPDVTTPSPKRTPRVVQIPVHFVVSESARYAYARYAYALKIQKAFRGFMVRKSVDKIMSIKRQVDAIEARISLSEVMDLIPKDGKERLKVNETLMALLLKLDAVTVCGVDLGIRVFRRAAIKKAIALQERVDSIATADPIRTLTLALPHEGNDSADAGNSNSEDQVRDEIPVQNFDDVVAVGNESCESSDDRYNDRLEFHALSHNKPLVESGQFMDTSNSEESMPNPLDDMEDRGASAEELECVEQNVVEKCDGQSEIKGGEYNCVQEGTMENVALGTELKVDSSLMEMEEVAEEERYDKTPAVSECVQESVEIGHNAEDGIEVNEEVVYAAALDMIGGDEKEVGNENRKEEEVLERIIEENRKMMKIMRELFERNEAQSRMLNRLTHKWSSWRRRNEKEEEEEEELTS